MLVETTVFYLYIMVAGVSGGEDMNVNIGRFESLASCEAVGAQSVKRMEEEAAQAELEGLETTTFSYRCSKSAPQGA